MSKINEVAELVEKGKAKLVGSAVQEAIDEGDDPVAILNDGMISAMSVVGEKFKNGEIYLQTEERSLQAVNGGTAWYWSRSRQMKHRNCYPWPV